MRQFLFKLHRVLGAVMSLYLLLWFLSAFVIIYHPYPGYSPQERESHQPSLSSSDMPNDSLRIAMLQLEGKSLRLSHRLGVGAVYELTTEEGKGRTFDHLGQELSEQALHPASFDAIAGLWGREVSSVDTLSDLDQWTPFARLREDLPFYRLNLSGNEGQQVYLSSKDGRILTEHTRSERLWAWLGAIPHWVYLTKIRQDADLWRTLVLILSGLGALMTLGGLYIGIDVMRRSRRSPRRTFSPYKHWSYRLHHIVGTLSGIFMLAWLVSGFFSVVEMPEWLTGKRDHSGQMALHSGKLPEASYSKEGWESIMEGEDIQSIEWTSLSGLPLVKVLRSGGEREVYDASDDRLKPLSLSLEEGKRLVERAFACSALEADELSSYDEYYISRERPLLLPVYRYKMDNAVAHWVYLQANRAEVRIFDRGDRVRMWVYTKPHGLKFPYLMERPLVWTIIVWTLLALGTIASATGILLTLRYIARLIRRQ